MAMSFIGLLSTAADQTAATPVDYTPAFIGLGGVIVGGLIQVWFQARQVRKQDRHRVRVQVAEYATTIALLLDYLVDLATDYEHHAIGETYLSASTRTHHLDRLREIWPLVHGQHAALIACSDSRLAEQATIANNVTDEEVLPTWSAIITKGEIHWDQFNEGVRSVRAIRKLMVSMVRPSDNEKVRGFRSANSVRDAMAKRDGKVRRGS